MNADGCIEVSLGRAAVERNRQTLKNFPGIATHHMAAEHLICRPLNNKFHHRSFITSRESVPEWPEAAPVNINIEIAGSRLVLAKTYGPAIRRAENDCRHI